MRGGDKMSDMYNDKKITAFNSLDIEERQMIKKVILGDKDILKRITVKSFDFDTAIMRGEPMTIAVPQNIVENLRDDYLSKISEKSINNDKQDILDGGMVVRDNNE